MRIEDDAADMARRSEAYALPGAPAIRGLVNARAVGEIGAEIGFTGAGINNVGIGLGHGQSADGSDRQAVRDRLPGNAAVHGLPHAAGNAAEKIYIGLAFQAAD